MPTDTALQRKAISFDKKSYNRFLKALSVSAEKIDDLRIPLNTIGKRFLEERKFIFDMTRSSPGAYKDLSPNYKKQKQRKLGFHYPILYYSGRLKRSITKRNEETIFNIGKKSLEIGTTVFYAEWLQMGTRKMPAREFLFWGPESPRFANHRLVKKQNKAMAVTLFSFIERKLGRDLNASIKSGERKFDRIFGGL